ncbi:MAG: hypothetical protein H7096_01370 [Flavobacterium sp.]|nr:hypothetical protein [Pedobacter sp.]
MQKKQIHFDRASYQKAQEQAQEKKTILEKAKEEFTKITKSSVTDTNAFSSNFIQYAIDKIKEQHPEAKPLRLTDEKFLNLYDYDLSHLRVLNSQYCANNSTLKITANKAEIIVSEDLFKIFTQTELQNKRFEAVNELVEVAKKLQKEFFPHLRLMHVFHAMPLLVHYNFDIESVEPFYGAILKD